MRGFVASLGSRASGGRRRTSGLFEPLESRRLLAAAITLFDSAGFEAPRYAVRPLEGQDALGPWMKDTTRTGVASVQNGVVQSGAQAVRLTRPGALDGDTRYGVIKRFTPAGDLDVLRVSWDMNVARNEQAGVPFGPFLGVEAYDTVGFTPLLIGSLGVDASTGDVLYQDGTTGVLTETGFRVSFDQWNHFTIEVDYASDTYAVFVNEDAKASTGFVNDAAGAFSDAPLSALAASADSVATATGTAFIDNYRIEVFNEPTAPTVTGVYVAGSAWSTPFVGLLEAKRLGSADLGYAVPAGNHQLDVLPWDNLDRLSITFNRDVLVARDDLNVVGTNGGGFIAVGFGYERASKTATWVLDRPLRNDKVLLELKGDGTGVKARDGVTRLDGDWSNSADAFPSGDGTPGGDFEFRINVLPGDVNRSHRVDATDLVNLRDRQRSTTDIGGRSRTGYSIFHDVNGDAALNAVDVARVRRSVGTTLPLSEPVAPASVASASVASIWLDIQPEQPATRRQRPPPPS